MEQNKGYTILKSTLFENNHGVALGHNPAQPYPFATWYFTESKSGERDYYRIHECINREVAERDFSKRVSDYKIVYKVQEKTEGQEPGEYYRYYSTQRPIDIGTFPNSDTNPVFEICNYDGDTRQLVAGGQIRAWGELTYKKPLTEKEQWDYELQPSPENPDLVARRAALAQKLVRHPPIVAQMKETEKPRPDYIYKMEANPRSDGIDNRFFLQAYESIGHGRAIPRDVLYIGTPEKCRELLGRLTDGTLTQGQVKELFKKEMEPRPIAEQLKQAEKLAGENRAQPAPKKDAPDKGDR